LGRRQSGLLARWVDLLASVGDSQRVGRHDPRRARGRGPYWHLALSGEKASRPFVVTCPDCRQRCRVDTSLPVDDLAGLSKAVRIGNTSPASVFPAIEHEQTLDQAILGATTRCPNVAGSQSSAPSIRISLNPE